MNRFLFVRRTAQDIQQVCSIKFRLKTVLLDTKKERKLSFFKLFKILHSLIQILVFMVYVLTEKNCCGFEIYF